MKSQYSCTLFEEEKRLDEQAKATKKIDSMAIKYIYKKLNLSKRKFYVLDVGCANGAVSIDRFGKNNNAFVLGIDINQKIIEKNIENNCNKNIIYKNFDIEDADFLKNIQKFINQNKIPKFDIVFVSYVLQHLKDPLQVLKKLKLLLNQNGAIIVRGSDDGSKLACNDENLVGKIINLYNKAEGISDRYNGRKIYSQLWDSGFKDIKMFFDVLDTSQLNKEQRLKMFYESFSYRINIFKTLEQKYPDNKKIKQQKLQMEKYLKNLERLFQVPNFWYAETQFLGVGWA